MDAEDIWTTASRLLQGSVPRVIIDGGANQGDMAQWFFAEYPLAEIHCFEPDPETFGPLAARFSAKSRVQPVNAAIAAVAGTANLHRCTESAASSLYPRNRSGRRYYYSHLVMQGTIAVATVTLDQFCREKGIEHIDLLKLDLQGGEHAALRGAAGLLRAQAIDVIATEFFIVPHYEGAPLLDSIWSLLRDHGYDMYDLKIARYGRNGQARWGDAIFVSTPYRERYLDSWPPEP